MFFSGNSKKNRVDYSRRRDEDLLAKLEVERKERLQKRVNRCFSYYYYDYSIL